MKQSTRRARDSRITELGRSPELLPAWCRHLVGIALQLDGVSAAIVGIRHEDRWMSCASGAEELATEAVVDLCEQIATAGRNSSSVEPVADFKHCVGIPIRDAEGVELGAVCILKKGEEPFGPHVTRMLSDLTNLITPLFDQVIRYTDDSLSSVASLAFLIRALKEIQPPLTNILSLSDVLRQEVTGTSRKRANIVHASAGRAVHALKSILDLVQLESGGLDIHPHFVDLAGIARDVLEECRPRIRERGLSVELTAPSCEVSAFVDELSVRQLLGELLSNAIRFTKAGGITIEVIRGSDVARVRVVDTGVGISEQFLPLLFEPFSREGEPVSQEPSGAGLGLAIARKHAEVNGGFIRVESHLNRGTSVTLSLPLRTSLSPTAPTVMPIRHDLTGKPLILLVEDNDVTVRVMERILQKDYEVISAMNVDEALERAREYQFDLLLLDIALNERRTGVEVLHEIRGMVRYQAVPALACTAYSLPGIQDRYLETGFDGYVAKPFRADELRDVIKSLITNGRAPDKTELTHGRTESGANGLEERVVIPLPQLPKTLRRILECLAAGDATARIEEITGILEADSEVTSWVLGQANSAFYGVRGKVETVDRAVALLGAEPVYNLVAAGVLAQIFETDGSEAPKQVYNHILKTSIGAAGFARLIAERVALENPELAFTAGILHDIGRLCMLSHEPEQYARLWGRTNVIEPPELGQELLNFGGSHSMLAEQLGREWELPMEIRAVIKYHEEPEDAPVQFRRLSVIVAAARAASIALLYAEREDLSSVSSQMRILGHLEEIFGVPSVEIVELLEVNRDSILSLMETVYHHA